MKVCMSENEMFLQWGELRKGERSYQAEWNPSPLKAKLLPPKIGFCFESPLNNSLN